MTELKFVTLENGQEYFVIAETIVNNRKYYLLVNSKNGQDFVIRKEKDDLLIGLKDINELYLVISNLVSENIENPQIKKALIELKQELK